MATQTLQVRIISPQKLLLNTQASSVSSENIEGKFDVLPEHANFMTLLENAPITVRPYPPPAKKSKQTVLTFKFPVAIMLVISNKVNIYTYSQPQSDPL